MAMYAAALVSRQLWSGSTLDSLQGRVYLHCERASKSSNNEGLLISQFICVSLKQIRATRCRRRLDSSPIS